MTTQIAQKKLITAKYAKHTEKESGFAYFVFREFPPSSIRLVF